jgi:hypothetical protein
MIELRKCQSCTVWRKSFALALGSVADPGCLSRILIFTHPGSRIQKQQQGVKKNFFSYLCSHKFQKIENYFSFEVLKKKIWAICH